MNTGDTSPAATESTGTRGGDANVGSGKEAMEITSEAAGGADSIGTMDLPASDGLLEESLARRFVRDSTGCVAGHPVAGLVAVILFMDLVGARLALAWFGFLLLATGLRAAYSLQARKVLDRPLAARKAAFMGTVLVALVWGLAGILFGLQLPSDHVGFLLVILSGLIAVSTVTLVGDDAAFYGFSTILLGSILVSVGARGLGLVNPLDAQLSFGLIALDQA